MHFWCPDKKIITLDQYNISDYISLPGYIIDKHNRGIISHTHFSDIIRAELLIQHGGTWIDSTVFCTGRKFTEFMQLPLFASNTSNLYPFYMVASSWFIVSEAHNPIITLTRDLLFEYWKSHNYLIHYFLFHMFFKMAAKKYPEEWSRVPYVDNAPWIEMGKAAYDDYSDEKMKYFAGLSDLHKMSYKFDSERLTPSSILQHVIDSYK